MASPLAGVIELLLDRIDADLLTAIYGAASLSPMEIRAAFERDDIPYLDPATGRLPPLPDVEAAAERVIRQSRNRATTMGAVAGLAGPIALPPEVLAGIVHTLRLAQRLAVLFGFDTETEAGRIVMLRALAAVYGIDLPAEGQVGVRLRDLPVLLQRQLPDSPQARAWVARQMIQRGRELVLRRIARVVPGLSTGLSAWAANQRTEEAGRAMLAVYRRASDSLPLVDGEETIAVIVG